MFKKFILAAALAFSATASSAALCDVGSCTVSGANGQPLSDIVRFTVTEIVNEADPGNPNVGTFNFVGSFVNDLGVNLASAAVTVFQFEPTALASIADLTLTIFAPASIAPQTFQITDANGAPAGALTGSDLLIQLGVATTDPIEFELQGVAQPDGSNNPGFSLRISAVPLPAGAVLLTTGLIGLGFASRRRKA